MKLLHVPAGARLLPRTPYPRERSPLLLPARLKPNPALRGLRGVDSQHRAAGYAREVLRLNATMPISELQEAVPGAAQWHTLEPRLRELGAVPFTAHHRSFETGFILNIVGLNKAVVEAEAAKQDARYAAGLDAAGMDAWRQLQVRPSCVARLLATAAWCARWRARVGWQPCPLKNGGGGGALQSWAPTPPTKTKLPRRS